MNKKRLNTIKSIAKYQDKNIFLYEDFSYIIPEMKDEEYKNLTNCIIKNGIIYPIIICEFEGEYILIDGKYRLKIIHENNLDINTLTYKVINFKDINHAKEFIIEMSLSRKNLTSLQLSRLRNDLYELKKKNKDKNVITKEEISKSFKVSPRTIMNDRLIVKGLDIIGEDSPFFQKAIEADEIKVPKRDLILLAQKIESKKSNLKITDLESLKLVLHDIKRNDRISKSLNLVLSLKLMNKLNSYTKEKNKSIKEIIIEALEDYLINHDTL